MSEDQGISTIQFKVDQQLKLEGARSISEIEDVSIATEITSFDRQNDSYLLEGAILLSGFIRAVQDPAPEQWPHPVSDVFDADPVLSGRNGIHPLYYRLPFELRVPIAAQEGPFFNVTARVGAWNLAVNEEDQVHVKADLIIQGLSGAGGYEFRVASQQETRDALGALVNPSNSAPVDSPFVTYEHREWVLEGNSSDPNEEVIFTRDLISQSQSDAQDESEAELQETEEETELLQTTMEEKQESVAEQESDLLEASSAPGGEQELVETRQEDSGELITGPLFPEQLSTEQFPERPMQPDAFQDLFLFANDNKLTPPFVTELPMPQFGQQPEAGESPNEAIDQPAAFSWEGSLFQPVEPAAPVNDAEPEANRQHDAVQGLPGQWADSQLLQEPALERAGGLYDTEASPWQPLETYQFAFPEASPQQTVSGEREGQALANESSPSYSIHAALQQESSGLSFSGFAAGHPFREELQEEAIEQIEFEDSTGQEDVLVEQVADGSSETAGSVTSDSLWSSFHDKSEASYTLVFRIAQEGETIEEICEKFSVPMADLLRENQLTRDENYTGKLLYIPTYLKK